GRAVPWGLLSLICAALGLGLPRDGMPWLGPSLFVATALTAVLWLANRAPGTRDQRPRPGTPERAAQQMLGLRGEQHVSALLARDLPDDYVLINGLALPRAGGDIDHLVIGPTGVFVLETKTMAGR